MCKMRFDRAPTEFHLSLHKRTEYLDVLLETMFNLILNIIVILHSEIIPENVPKTPLITPVAPEIMHLGRFCLQCHLPTQLWEAVSKKHAKK